MKNETPTYSVERLQAIIDKCLSSGSTVVTDDCGSDEAMFCECCGRHGGKKIVLIEADAAGEWQNDPMAYQFAILGTSCLKKFRLTKKV